MSDSEGNAPPHATTGGKSLSSVQQQQRQPYKSWRKKYRKMRHKFDGVLEENKRLFKDEQKLEGMARRLREELDGLMDLLLDLNTSPALPPDLRYDISLPTPHTAVGSIPSVVPDDVTPDAANKLILDYTDAVSRGQIPHLDLHVIRVQVDKKLAAQGVRSLNELASSVSHAVPPESGELPEDLQGSNPPAYLTFDEEDAYLQRLDAKLSNDRLPLKKEEEALQDKHWADLTPREVERQIELQNPQSQHNWLRTHQKPGTGLEVDDADSLGSHETRPAPARGGKGKRDLAKQVGDRAVGRAREVLSPGSGFGDEDDYAFVDENPASTKKRGKADPDGPYRAKGGKAAKGKRKRTSDETASAKKAKTADD
ncbi:unnamed protein product [Lecanosticta acicola]|uniref:Unnamed protein product n=1 Tax=Lecanosticta acicola TaxID=111012 RepID=A0AAI8W0D0_9PEZI|nr:unnamed protein product [Lecanosticta acicola]